LDENVERAGIDLHDVVEQARVICELHKYHPND
jgi:hypothetical protein